MFLMFFICGVLVAINCEDRFGKLLGFGIAFLITVQAAINIGVVTGSLPTKGITLPFISFGGSSMLMTLAMVGILINISGCSKPLHKAYKALISLHQADEAL